MDAARNKSNANLIDWVKQNKKSDFSITDLGKNLNLNSIAQQQIDKVITSNSNDTGLQPVADRRAGRASLFWSSLPDSVKPAQYLNRLHNESAIGSLPVKLPVVPDNSI